MGFPAAKQMDQVLAVDIHIIMIPSPGGPVPTPIPHPFIGMLQDKLCEKTKIMQMAAATKGSIANNMPPHIPMGGPFQKPPDNKATIEKGSMTVKLEGKDAARMLDQATSCNDMGMKMHAIVMGTAVTVLIGNGGADSAALAMPWA
jgi:uncharacterized Zn-binding protein involved in type VI secretion